MNAIDGSSAYHGWKELVAKVKGLLTYERENIGRVQLNAADLDEVVKTFVEVKFETE